MDYKTRTALWEKQDRYCSCIYIGKKMALSPLSKLKLYKVGLPHVCRLIKGRNMQ